MVKREVDFLKSPCPRNEKSQKPNFEGFDQFAKKKKRVFSILLFTSSCTYNLKAQTDLFFCCFTLEESTKLAFFFHWFHCCQVKKALCVNFEGKKKQNCADNRDQDFSNTLVNY